MVVHPSRQRRSLPRMRWPWLFVSVAWIVAVLAALTGQGLLIDHHFLLEESGLSWPFATLIFLIGWQFMIAAMMAPTSIPIVTTRLIAVDIPDHDNPRLHRALALFFIGFASAWTIYGLLAFIGDTLIHRVVDIWPWLADHSALIGATTFAVAGVFQFSGWKRVCLARCRDPRAFFSGEASLHAAREANGWRHGLRHGLRHGADSIGCCWALMLVMFGVGMDNPGWMVGLTVAMFAETIIPGETASRRICQVAGVILCALAIIWLAHPVWLAFPAVS